MQRIVNKYITLHTKDVVAARALQFHFIVPAGCQPIYDTTTTTKTTTAVSCRQQLLTPETKAAMLRVLSRIVIAKIGDITDIFLSFLFLFLFLFIFLWGVLYKEGYRKQMVVGTRNVRGGVQLQRAHRALTWGEEKPL